MGNSIKRIAVLLTAGLFMVFLTSCMSASVDELYSLPQISEEYVQLQELIGSQIDAGGSYAAPTDGSNRQSVQLRDLDGDNEAEALAFLADENHAPVICIYKQGEDGNYYQFATILAEGSAVHSVDYADLNGDGCAELIVAWQIGGNLRQLSVYALSRIASAQQTRYRLLSADCSLFVVFDLDGDGIANLLNLQLGPGSGASLVMYTLDTEGEVQTSSVSLSSGVTAIRRAISGTLSDGTAALFVESDLDTQGLVTDVFTTLAGELCNITLNFTETSEMLRPDGLFSEDLDGDGTMDIPAGSGDFISWYDMDIWGNTQQTAITYLNTEDGWYLVMPDSLVQGITAEKHGTGGEESAVVFLKEGDESTPQRSVLVIYALTGENRQERAQVDSRFILRQDVDTVYAAQLLTDELDSQEIIDRFYILYDQWQMGAV